MVGEEDGTGIVFTICFVEYWWKNIQLNRLTFVQIVYSSQPEGNGRHHSWNVPGVRQSSQSLKCRQWCERVAEVQGAFKSCQTYLVCQRGNRQLFSCIVAVLLLASDGPAYVGGCDVSSHGLINGGIIHTLGLPDRKLFMAKISHKIKDKLNNHCARPTKNDVRSSNGNICPTDHSYSRGESDLVFMANFVPSSMSNQVGIAQN